MSPSSAGPSVAVGLIDDVSTALFQAHTDWSYVVMSMRL
jgi:hypothetical protein